MNVDMWIRALKAARASADASQEQLASLWAADRWYPSSKTCSACGKVNTGLTLSDRSWTCLCGVTHDRDHNAARNLLAAMHTTSG
jgi:transposase